MPSLPGSSNWQIQMPAYTPIPNWQPPIPLHPGDVGLCDSSPYTPLPATTELPKKHVGKTKKNFKNDNLSPLNLGNAFAHDNVGGDDVLITGVHDTGIYFTYKNVDPNKVTRQEYNDFTHFILNPYEVYLDCYMMGYLVPEFFWRQVPHLCMPRSHSVDNPYEEGWLSGDQMNAWIEILIRSRPQDADWTVSKSGRACVHPENNQFIIQTDPHIIGTLDGSTRPYPSWKNINWVYMPINTRLLLEDRIKARTPVINGILQMRAKLCAGHVPIVPRESERYWENIRYEMGELFYKCRCENTRNCGYD
ncbi:hypothetical protein Tco_1038130 [Tanacetum coccineum]